MAESGKIEYTERAFAQDADLAMAGDPMRGLVELITNCDDAYGAGPGDIEVVRILDEDGRASIAVRDNGPGLTPQRLQECFSKLGGKNSGFHEGDDVRGFFGRGAKDTAAFGRTTFESIKDGTYGVFTLSRAGEWSLEDHPATPEDHARLAIPEGGSGLVATIHFEINPRVLPSYNDLSKKIGNHVQLRRVSRARRITVRNHDASKPRNSTVVRWNPPSGELLFDGEIAVAGYPASATLTIKKLKAPSSEPFNPYASWGVEIRGSRAVYQLTKFEISGHELRWIHATVECSMIDALIRDFGSKPGADDSNPIPLVRRDRDGLTVEHPFTIALRNAVLSKLGPILDDLKPSPNQPVGSKRFRSDLDDVGKQLGALLEHDLEDIDDPDRGDGQRPTTTVAIQVIPPRATVRVGRRRTMTVLVNTKKIEKPEGLVVSSSDTAYVQVSQLTPFVHHATFENTVIANFTAEALEIGRAVVSVNSTDRAVSASAEIRVSDDPAVDEEEPTEFRWRNSSMSVTGEKTRTITLEAPVELAPGGILESRIEIDGRAIELLDDRIELTQNSSGWLSGRCRIKGVEVGESVRIRATAGPNEAVGTVTVKKPSGLEGLGLTIDVVDNKAGDFRSLMKETDNGHSITIYARHEGLTDLIGRSKNDGSFENEGNIEVRVALAEIIGSTIADWLLTREAQKSPGDFPDADAVLARRNTILNKYSVAVQRLLTQARG